MIVTSSAIKNGYFDDKYGKRGNDTEKKVPLLSFPFEIAEEPEGTVSYAWIHWMAANVRKKFIPEDFSRQNKNVIQGENSWGLIGYGGMTPPNTTHRYDLHVYALDTTLELQQGFSIEDLYRAMGEHILDSFTLSGKYTC